jgi:hypothetical protein
MKKCAKLNCSSVARERSNYCDDHQLKPTPPPGRIIREGGSIAQCRICGSSMKRAWFGFGRLLGCIQPKCWNFHGWRALPAGTNRSPDLYGAPRKPPAPPAPPGAAHSAGPNT